MSKKLRVIAGVAGAVLAASLLAALPAEAASKANSATSAKSVGGLNKLIVLAKAEKELNVIALPPDWANWGEIIPAFEKKYGIKVNSANPDGSSAEEIAAVKALKGQDRQPDVVDVGLPFAVQGAAEGLFAPYKVSTWNDIPKGTKQAGGKWFFDYGGYIAIGYDALKVSPAPTSLKGLLNAAYKGQVALNGNPTKSGAAFAGVFATALANGGSLNSVGKGLDFWKQMKKIGNFIPVEATPATVQSGQTPITLDWDYLQGKYSKESAGKVNWKVVVPSDAIYGGFYAQAVVKDSPHPAAARLWQEFLYSDEGQNLFLKGGARPIRLPAMQASGTANATYLANLPVLPAGSNPLFANLRQILAAKDVIGKRWGTL